MIDRTRDTDPPAPPSADRWREVEPLLDEVLDLPPEARPAFLHAACSGDAVLRAEVERMIEECAATDVRLDRPAAERFAALLEDETPGLPPALAERFHITRELGRGGMATVYLALEVKHGREVAVKMLRRRFGASVGAERFLAEIRVTARLRHPHILPLFDSGKEDGVPYYAALYAEGGSVRDLLASEGRLPPARALQLAVQVADALADAHAHGIIHRDIKPENILLARGGDHAYVADFGIALVLDAAGHERATRTGYMVGTPAYMSPEQLRGERELDGRTDVYSLGCVVHEMLTGALPSTSGTASGAITPLSGGTRRLGNAVPRAVEGVVMRALATARADRYPNASEFARALAAAAAPPSAARRAMNALALRPLAVAGTALVLTGMMAATPAVRAVLFDNTAVPANGGIAAAPADAAVDPDAIAVIPFPHTAGPTALTGDDCARRLYEALARWNGLRLSDEVLAHDSWGRDPRRALSVQDAAAIARRAGAGRFVWGEVLDQGGVTRISARLHDARRGTSVSQAVYVRTADELAPRFAELADSLVAKLAGPLRAGHTAATHNFTALEHYVDGYAALDAWDTDSAEAHFRQAVALDPGFAQASLGLAQAMSWSRRYQAPAWHEAAARADAGRSVLSPRERLLAGALLAMSESRMADACVLYRDLTTRDPRDYTAQFGLGDCLSMDQLVVRDAMSPTRWRFRGSLHAAVQAYRAALTFAPHREGSHAATFARLTRRVLFTEPIDYRLGFALRPDTVWMGAFPELLHDTLAFHPMPIASLWRAARPASRREALASNQRQLLALATGWVNAFPESADAHENLADVLETVGTFDGQGSLQRAADELARARRLRGDSRSLVRRAAAHVRILLKLHRFADAAAVADSTIVARPSPTPSEAALLAPLAALGGRARLTAGLLALAAADSADDLFRDSPRPTHPLPPALAAVAAAFSGYAALAAPVDSVQALYERTEHAVQAWYDQPEQERMRTLLLLPAAVQAQPALGMAPLATLHEPPIPILGPWQALARGDAAGARQLYAALTRPKSGGVTLEPEPDLVLRQALLALALRDTAAAVATLERIVVALPQLSSRVTTEVAPAGALPRVLALHAQLSANHRSGIAPLWASAAVLWAHADREVRAGNAPAEAPPARRSPSP